MPAPAEPPPAPAAVDDAPAPPAPTPARVPRLDRPSSASRQTPAPAAPPAEPAPPAPIPARVPRSDRPSSAPRQASASADGSETLADAFRAVSRQLRHQAQQALAPWDVTPSQARALGVLTRHGPVRLGTLSEHLRIAPRSATEVVDTLTAAGLVARHPDPGDRRATLVTLTSQGGEVAAAIRAARAAEADDFFARLDEDDRAALAGILAKLRT